MEYLKSQGMLRSIPQIDGRGKWIKEISQNENSTNNTKLLLNLSSNDYLGIINREDLTNEFITYITKTHPCFSSASSRLLTGNSSAYNKLEALLCKIFNKEAALVFNSGYHANIGILPALCKKDSLIIADKLVHASIIDGIKLSGCKFERFKHNDCNHLESIIKREQDCYKSIFIVTESIFSMSGDRAPLKNLVMLKKRYPQIILYVDEAHAFGVYGAEGLGLSEECNILQDVDILVATFGKAISSIGAFVVCSGTI
ncbi:MAG: aminotransferase class I/II-fold pyridoxal phosphate-dependent enzyme, partial [Bacteroidales bacterium]